MGRRTSRVMCAICRGQHLVQVSWLQASLCAGKWAVETGHFPGLGNDVPPRFFKSLKLSIERARAEPLLFGRSVYIFPAVAVRTTLEEVVRAASGRVLRVMPAIGRVGTPRPLLIGTADDA